MSWAGFDLFSIGIGPSSSHTVGPMRAARLFCEDLQNLDLFHQIHSLRVDVYGSLALTGVGHGTPNAILMGLQGEKPESIEPSTILSRSTDIHTTKHLHLLSSPDHRILFDPAKDLHMHYYSQLPQHPNGLRFTAFDKEGDMLATNDFFSVGGGFVVNGKTTVSDNAFYRKDQVPSSSSSISLANSDEHDMTALDHEEERSSQSQIATALPFRTAADILDICQKKNISIAQIVYQNELKWHSPEQVKTRCLEIWTCMDESIRNGCLSKESFLPGKLRTRRRAPGLYSKLMRGLYPTSSFHTPPTDPTPSLLNTSEPLSNQLPLSTLSTRRPVKRMQMPALDYLTVYAIAVNEENAAGGRVVTAPTNGAAGVIPSVLKFYLEFLSENPEKDIVEFLLTSAAIGMLYKRSASISAAEMGCQGEIGVACSMAAAAFAAVMGGTPEQVENAAEIGMEHNLGLTCDPIDGLVQIPCVERVSMGAVKAVTAAQLALNGDGTHRVSLDQVIETMRQTGIDMQQKYKETSQGGLAVNVPLC